VLELPPDPTFPPVLELPPDPTAPPVLELPPDPTAPPVLELPPVTPLPGLLPQPTLTMVEANANALTSPISPFRIRSPNCFSRFKGRLFSEDADDALLARIVGFIGRLGDNDASLMAPLVVFVPPELIWPPELLAPLVPVLPPELITPPDPLAPARAKTLVEIDAEQDDSPIDAPTPAQGGAK
jgi:hypothetical protein